MLKNIVKIQHNSDFTLNCKLPSGYDNQDFIIRLYTTDKDNYYEASYLNGEYMNCLTDSENKNIVVYVNNHNLQPGCLHIGMQFDYDNTHFSDNVENIITAEETNVYLVKQNANATSAMYVGSALPDLTGSTDFVTQSDLEFELLNYYTKEDIDNASYISSSDLNDYVTEEELNDMGFLSQAQLDAMGYTTKDYVDTKTNQKQDRLINGVNIKTINGNSLLGNGDLVIEGGGSAIDMSAYVTHTFLQNQAYVTQSALNSMSYVTSSQLNNASYVTHAELNNASYVTQSALNSMSYATQSFVDDAVADAITEIDVPTKTSDLTNDSGFITASALNGYVTESQLQQAGYATETYVADYVATHSGPIDLSAYVTYDWLEAQSYVTEQALATASYVTSSDLSNMSYVTTSDLTGYATETYVADYVATHSGPIDLSAYVSKDELNQMGYVSQSDLSNASYVTEQALATASYVTESEIAAMGYVTESQLQQAGYVTSSDLSNMSYVTTSDLNTAISGINVPTKTSDLTNDSGFITSIPAEYVTESELSGIGYVTATELSNAGYMTGSQISQMGYITMSDVSACGYITSIPSEYVTETELSAKGYITSIPSEYVTETELSSMGYITSSALPTMSDYVSKTELSQAGYLTSIPAEYVTQSELSTMGYITSSDIPIIPVIDESIIPNTTDTYTIGDSSHLYDATYTNRLYVTNTNYLRDIQNTGFGVYRNNTLVAKFTAGSSIGLKPGGTSRLLGSDNEQWLYTYSANFIENGTNISDKYATKVELTESLIPNTTLTYTLGDSSHFYDATYTSRVNGPDNGMVIRLGNTGKVALYGATFRPASNNNMTLGTANQKWSTTYSYHYYQDDKDIEDIYTQTEVVTQAQYDALTTEEKNSETIYVISDQQAYMNNELVTEQSLSAKGYLTANNFQYDQSTGTLTLIL